MFTTTIQIVDVDLAAYPHITIYWVGRCSVDEDNIIGTDMLADVKGVTIM